jgi:hypothetical protein
MRDSFSLHELHELGRLKVFFKKCTQIRLFWMRVSLTLHELGLSVV